MAFRDNGNGMAVGGRWGRKGMAKIRELLRARGPSGIKVMGWGGP